MRKLKCISTFLFALTLCVAFISCEEENGVEGFTPKEYNVSGRVEKGPFVSGSAITIQPMSEQMQALGSMYASTIQDHLGNFTFGSKIFESPYAELTANGYFFNEVTGMLSSGTLYLRAIVDLTKSETVNVNILTHIKYQRILNLISQGKTYAEANKQAQQELFSEFGLQKYADKDASQYSIVEGTDESAALIAISCLILVDRSEAEITEYLARLCQEFADNGTFSEESKGTIKEDRDLLEIKLSSGTIESNIQSRYEELGVEIELKKLALFFDWNDDGIVGNEILKEGEAITLETKLLEVPYIGGTYTINIDSPIPLSLEPRILYPEAINNGGLYYEYELSYTAKIENTTLYIDVKPSNACIDLEKSIPLYDFMGNVVETIEINQEKSPNAVAPPLGEYGVALVSNMASYLAGAASRFNLIEQYYHYNNVLVECVSQNIQPYSNHIADMWNSFYEANKVLAYIKYLDKKSLDIYGEFLDVFSAMMYYYMVVGWGDVPYVLDYEELEFNGLCHSKTNKDEILDNLTENLKKSIEELKEEKNESLNQHINGFFFVSKDVPRILLSNIYMYRGKYSEAIKILKDVIDSGFYVLNNDSYSNPETIDQLLYAETSDEVIFAFGAKNTTRDTEVEFIQTRVIPIMNYTDVVLSYAECLYHGGEISMAEMYLSQVVEAKGIEVAEGVFEGIMDARRQLLLYANSNFAFYKRNGIAVEELKIEEYQQLLPIPQRELNRNENMTQNFGY